MTEAYWGGHAGEREGDLIADGND
eukprot:COSAG03_NODE_16907_length_389_cov_0.386207_2_plen_23_part_01